MIINALRGLGISIHKAIALSALRDGKKPSRRFARYNYHMKKARALELLILGKAPAMETRHD